VIPEKSRLAGPVQRRPHAPRRPTELRSHQRSTSNRLIKASAHRLGQHSRRILLFFAGLARVGPTVASLLGIAEPVITVTTATLILRSWGLRGTGGGLGAHCHGLAGERLIRRAPGFLPPGRAARTASSPVSDRGSENFKAKAAREGLPAR
jgi:hypothetical protein